ncbi:MAG: nucleotidyltransferase family protein [Armatimonadota bacterium]
MQSRHLILLPCSDALRFLGAAIALSGPDVRALEAVSPPHEEWGRVSALAAREGVRPLAFWRLREAGLLDGLPADVVADWQADFDLTQARNAVMLSEAEQLLRALSSGGLSVACLKGAVFAEGIYPHPAVRPMTDIDLLVLPHQVGRAASILGDCGYRRAPTAQQDHVYVKGCETGAQPFGCTVELQHDLLTGRFGNRKVARLRVEELWDDMTDARVGATPCLTLSPVHCLLFLAAHMAIHHGAFRLLWLADVAYYLASTDGLDWERLVECAGRYGLRAALGWSLRLSRDFVSARVPDAVLAELNVLGRPTGALGATSWEEFSRDARIVARAAFLDSAIDRLLYLSAIALRPTGEGRPQVGSDAEPGRPPLWRLAVRFARALRTLRRVGP